MSSKSETTASNERSSTIQSAGHRTCSIKLCYQHLAVSYALYLFLAPILAAADDFIAPARSALKANLPFTIAVLAVVAAVLASVYLMRRPRAVYLLDLACYKPGAEHAVTRETFMRLMARYGTFSDDSLAFQRKILERSGLGQGTNLPKALITSPPNSCMAEARSEAEAVMFGAVGQVLAKTGVRPWDIRIVVVNSGLCSPTPSLSAMIVNHYKLRGNVSSYNLGGMGCSASLISVDLAKQLL
ncbi:3-ketoacyl-CoA synthase 20-like [Miscanthus floridulus]|uniref:3-ketoacyl-CoA synthase 20-like n=1 Tax=Miscanthus floridulus TaxID=154761 RepID=UPI003459276A